ncbi:MAG: hypothetical protein HFJ33_05470 [Clostridia bacterium]|uniref:hypothetical protein n=1 Tax=Thomasclavelia cocleata TaxID=69824 RepID=UPI00272EAB88|nr:hypothetical protein [Thomasclavelia cocleata]MCI8384291.1 hypothetical protein [Clostridia bacterium]
MKKRILREFILEQELKKFKDFWYSIMSHFHERICYDKDNNYKIVSDDLYKNGVFDSNDNEIANNIARKVTIQDENKQRIKRKIMILDFKGGKSYGRK